MNNLKRVLSLALASVMLIGMMAVGASAFSDDEKIENKEAVDTMVSLSIIDGMPDGSYDPDGLLLREQAAKMVFVALNGGKKNDNLTTKTTPTFSDIKGNWAEGYIEWCANRGIIAGMGDGTFNPKGNLTGTALAKIMLVAIGYDAKEEGLEGTTDWALNVNALALGKGFFDGLEDIDPEANITRDDAALLILNACQAEMVEYNYQLNTNGNGGLESVATVRDVKSRTNNSTTILDEKYSLHTRYGYLTQATYNDDKKEYTYRVQATNASFGATITGAIAYSAGTITSDKDFSDLFGQRVKVLYKLVNGKVVLYGLTSDATVIAEGAWGKATNTATTFKFGGTTYDKNQDTVIEFLDGTATDATATTLKQYAFKAYDNDSDGNIDVVVTFPFAIETITYKSSSNFSTKYVDGALPAAFAGALTGADLDDYVFYTGAAKGDYVKFTAGANLISGEDTFEKVEVTVEGKVDGTKTGQVRVDGTWYAVGDLTVAPVLNKTYKFFVENGYIAAAEEVATNTTDAKAYALAIGVGTGLDGAQARLLLTDGTKVDVAVDSTGVTPAVVGNLYTYTVSEGKYKLTNAKKAADKVNAATDKANTGYDAILTETNNYAGADGQIDSVDVDDTAIIFTQNASKTKFAVITGADLKKYPSTSGATKGVTTVAAAYSSTNATTKFKTVALASVILDDDAKIATKNIGYVTSGLTKVRNADDTADVSILSFWTADGQVTDATATADLSLAENGSIGAGSVIKYVKNPDGTYNITLVDDADYGAIIAWDASTGAITFSDANKLTTVSPVTSYKVTSDTVVLYIDSANKKGIEGGEIALAQETTTSGTYYGNVFYDLPGSGKVLPYLIVDTSANLSANAAGTVVLDADDTTAANLATALAKNVATVNLDMSKLKNSESVTTSDHVVRKGQTLNLTGTINSNVTAFAVRVQAGGTLTVGGCTVIGGGLKTDGYADVTVAKASGNVSVVFENDSKTVTITNYTVGSATVTVAIDFDNVTVKGSAVDTTLKTSSKGTVSNLGNSYVSAGNATTARGSAADSMTSSKTATWTEKVYSDTNGTNAPGWVNPA